MSLVFYDTETTGTEIFFDQILQFAAVLTDEDLKEIDRFEVRCRLLPHVVPAPEAMSVTGVKVSQLTNSAYPSHYEMVRAISTKLLSWSPALFLGWNSIRFDEDLVRQAFYKTLHNPYLTNSGGNSRSDVMRIVQACSIYQPDALTFPTGADGSTIFKLDHIAPANGFNHDDAHDAMGDVQATIYLCRILVEKAPDIWSSFMRFSKKASVIDYINEEPVFCLNEFYFGRPFSFVVTKIGNNSENSAECYVFDLSVDPELMRQLTAGELAMRVTQSPKPVRKLKSNAAPMLFSADEAPDICKGRGLGIEELQRRAEILRQDAGLRGRLISALESQKEEYPPSPHVEKQIYDGFIGEPDQKLMAQFHDTEWPKRIAIVEKFQDPRLKVIGRQLIYQERPDLLDEVTHRAHDVAAAKRLLGQGEEISWLTLPQAIEQLDGMLVGASGAELKLLREHQQYLRKLHKQALKHVK
ncbi:MAG: exonuclease domain-containing protein [Verrucomicrobiota bacterium]|jgi:exodeoxyribonuclease-1